MRTKKKIFSIPYNGDLRLLTYALAQGCVKEVYFPAPHQFNIALFDKRGPFPPSHPEIEALMKLCQAHSVETNLLCNNETLLPFDLEKILSYARSLKGLASITVADLSYVPAIKAALPDLKIDVSFIANIHDHQKAAQAALLGVDVICIGNELNRDLDELRKVQGLKKKHKKLKIKTMVSDACSSSCLYFSEHYIYTTLHSPLLSVRMNTSSLFDNGRVCQNALYTGALPPAALLKHPFIRPEDMDFYLENGLIDIFKITNRSNTSATLRNKYDSYFGRNCVVDDFFDIYTNPMGRILRCDARRFPKDFLKKTIRCGRRCTDCDYCEGLAKKIISRKKH